MHARPGRPPTRSNGSSATLTIRLPGAVKDYLIDTAEGLDMSITEYLLNLIQRDAGDIDLGVPVVR